LLKLPKGLSAAVNFKNLFKKNKSARFSKSWLIIVKGT
jgi:hypothetical protein